MSCKIEGELFNKIKTVVPSHRAAVQAYILAVSKGGNIKTNVNNIIKLINSVKSSSKNDTEHSNVLSKMAIYGILKKESAPEKGSGNAKIYTSNNVDELAYEMLKEFKTNLYIDRVAWDIDSMVPSLRIILYSDKMIDKTARISKLYSDDKSTDNSYDMPISQDEIGKMHLGKTIISNRLDILPIDLQLSTIDVIVEKIARQVIESDKPLHKTQVLAIFSTYFNKIMDFRNSLEKADKKNGVLIMDEFINNWENLQMVALNRLKQRSGLVISGDMFRDDSNDEFNNTKNSVDNDSFDEESQRIRNNWADEFSISQDSKDTLSRRLKLFLSFIPTGESHKFFKGEQLYAQFDEVYNTISAILSDQKLTFESLVNTLKQYNTPAFQWMNGLINKLTHPNFPVKLQNEFVVAMNKHYVASTFVMSSKSNGKNKFSVWRDDSNAISQRIVDGWKINMSNGNNSLIKVDENGRQYYDKSISKSFNDLYDKIVYLDKTGAEIPLNMVSELLNLIGIDVNEHSLRYLANNATGHNRKLFKLNTTYSDRNSGIIGLFSNNSNSPFYIINNIIKSISTSKTIRLVEDDDIEASNSINILNDSSVKRYLASIEAKYTSHKYSNSHKSGDKTIYSYSNDKYIIDRHERLIRSYRNEGSVNSSESDRELIDELNNDIFARHSFWLKQLTNLANDSSDSAGRVFADNFKIEYNSLDVLKSRQSRSDNDRKTSELIPAEVLATKLAFLYNNGLTIDGHRIGSLFYPTTSDKTTVMRISAIMRDGLNYDPVSKSVDDGTVNRFYNEVVKSEIDRMLEMRKYTGDYTSGVNINKATEGSNVFYMFPGLNNISELFTPTTGNEFGINRAIDPDFYDKSELVDLVLKSIKFQLNEIIKNQIDDFKKLGIGYKIDSNGKSSIESIDSDAIEHFKNKLPIDSRSDENVSDLIAADYAMQYMFGNANVYQLFIGDPMMFFKKNVIDTFDNIGKRLAGDVAPGTEADFRDRKSIKMTVSKDLEVASSSLELITEMFQGSPELKSTIKSYSNINSTDAQSFSSLDFFLDTMYAFGSKYITEEQYRSLKDKIKKYGDDVVFDENELKIIMNPIKPVYVNNRPVAVTNGNTMNVRTYVKTSTFPLIPQLTKNTPLDTVRKSMNSNSIDLHVFESGVKVGAPGFVMDQFGNAGRSGMLSLFNYDGSINDNDVKLLGYNSIELPVEGFKIQQDVPYHDHPGDVNKGTQESKLLFSNIKSIDGFVFDGKVMSGRELEQEYNNVYKSVYQKQLDKLKEELINDDGSVDIDKLQKILESEAISKNYSVNDLIGLSINQETGKFNFPIWALPSADKYESMIISIVDNRVRKLKIPGSTYVLATETGFSFKKNIISDDLESKKIISKYQDQIIFTDNFDHATGSLKSYYRDDNGTMRGSQIFVPMKLKGRHGHFINVMNYTKSIKMGDGTFRTVIDSERLPSEFLKLFGFRIPTQGHNSMASMEIAGFLPECLGDMVIASKDLVTQMGSDFDVDKLYTYNYSTKEVLNDESQAKVDALIKESSKYEDENKYDFVARISNQIKAIKSNSNNYVIKRDESKDDYNKILDIHLAVFANDNAELYKLIMAPNGFGDLKRPDGSGLAKDIYDTKYSNEPPLNFLSPQYQMKKFFNGISGKQGVGVFSSSAMLCAISQETGMRYVEKDGFSMQFGDIISDGKLDGIYILGKNGEVNTSKYKSKVFEAFQSASVDNEKEQILFKLNIGRSTFGVINALGMLGFDEDVISYFISQPIIDDFIRESEEKTSSLKGFVVNENSTFENVASKWLSDAGISDSEIIENKSYSEIYNDALKMGVDDMKNMLKRIVSDKSNNSPISKNDVVRQLAILSKFEKLNSIGQELSGINSIVNPESKGFGKSLHGINTRLDKTVNMNSNTIKHNRGKLESGIINSEKILGGNGISNTTSMNGFVTETCLPALVGLSESVFPYSNKTLDALYKYMADISGISLNNITSEEKFKKLIFDSFKSYLYTANGLFSSDIESDRDRIMFDKFKIINGANVNTRPSLATIINSIMKTDIGKRNAFLSQLYSDPVVPGKPSIVKYRASIGMNLDESKTHLAFIDLFNNNIPTGHKNEDGSDYTTRDLSIDLIKHAYLNGGIQEAVEFVRYVPIEMLMHLGISDKLTNFATMFNDESFMGITTNDNGDVEHSKFSEQFFQHNPSMIKDKVKGNGLVSDNNKSDGIMVVSSSYIKQGSSDRIITEFEPILDGDMEGSYFLDPNNPEKPLPKYVVTKTPIGNRIYKFDGINYKMISNLGGKFYTEYTKVDDNNDVKSLISENNVPQVESKSENVQLSSISNIDESKIEGPIVPTNESTIKTSAIGYNAQSSMDLNNMKTSQILSSISKSGSKYADVANMLLQNQEISKFLDQSIKVVYSKINAKGRFSRDSNTLSIVSPEVYAFKSEEELHEVILHELIHAYTVSAIKKFDSGNTDLLTDKSRDAISRLNRMRKSIYNQLKALDKDKFEKALARVKQYIDRQLPSNERLSDYEMLVYGLNSTEEFTSMAMTHKGVRDLIDDFGREAIQNRKSIFREFLEAIMDILGINTEDRTLIKSVEGLVSDVVTSISAVESSSLMRKVSSVSKSQQSQNSATNDKLKSMGIGSNIIATQKIEGNLSESKQEGPTLFESKDLPISEEIGESLIKKYGEGAVDYFNKLNSAEKELIIKCL